ncbi:Fc receptor-like protein 5 [Dendropsophus ebraccatus]|uniref:Fc receptor-like protein 5 n=1 Tax=Dendropsophus ebraccatus TaxID=150705 RepID=UPI0038314EE8
MAVSPLFDAGKVNYSEVTWLAVSAQKVNHIVIRPAVTFTPNWGKVFTGESVTMTCVVESPEENQAYLWYKDNNQLQTEGQMFTIDYTKTSDTGDYQCQTPAGEMSESVILEVIYGYLILQVPAIAYEGDDVFLRCYSWPGYSGRRTLFYKDKMEFLPSDGKTGLLLKNIKRDMAGKYKCVKKSQQSLVATYSDESFIHVRELFSTPKLTVTPNPALEGDDVALTCYTDLSFLRRDTQLQFAFYRDGKNIQRFSPSNVYNIQPVHLEDSENYTCSVKAFSNNVRKESPGSYVQVHELFSDPLIIVSPDDTTEGDRMTLTCKPNLSRQRKTTELLFAFYIKGNEVQGFSSSNKYHISLVQLKDSGNYFCEVKTSTKNLRKGSQEINIQVQELFSDPLINVSPNRTTEGDSMTLTCDTSLSRNREVTELLFAFYVNENKVQGFDLSNKYHIPFVQLKDSGNYSCEVTTSTNTIRKKSLEINIQVQGAKSRNYELENIKSPQYHVGHYTEAAETDPLCKVWINPVAVHFDKRQPVSTAS